MRVIDMVDLSRDLVFVLVCLSWSTAEINSNGISAADENTNALLRARHIAARDECRKRGCTSGLGDDSQHPPKEALSLSEWCRRLRAGCGSHNAVR
jgi:hypothetical protein